MPEDHTFNFDVNQYNIDYKLKLEGSGGFQFVNDSLSVMKTAGQSHLKNETIFIQTDKTRYKPGQKGKPNLQSNFKQQQKKHALLA